MTTDVDFLVIGSGLAGLTYALHVANWGSVALLTKKTRADANSSWAQGGIAGVIGDDDSFELHVRDTLVAGAGLCNEDAVNALVREGPERIRELIGLGAAFNTALDERGQEILQLGREGGHSRNRIVHTADYTGWECERTLLEAVRADPRIVVSEHLFVTDLRVVNRPNGVECVGATAINGETGAIEEFSARATLLATGGCGQVYLHTTNPLVATGDGVAIAWRAGCSIANMEFIQFHPTTLYHPEARAFLITEALRGEGGILRHADGERFMERYHKLAELAPRDIVARAIVSEMRRRDVPCVYLDVTHLDPNMLREHFPTVYERCLGVGIDITREPIPIVPAQHYQCGGVVTDLNGATEIDRLYAAGEVACTGVHGANRLASNSLLEAMVFGHRAALHSRENWKSRSTTSRRAYQATSSISPGAPGPLANRRVTEAGAVISASLKEVCDETRRLVRQAMQRDAGIVRSTGGLLECRDTLRKLMKGDLAPATDVGMWETVNVTQVALLIVESALTRHESRGLHYTTDYPETLDRERHDTVVRAPLDAYASVR